MCLGCILLLFTAVQETLLSTLCIVFRAEMNRISHHSSLFAGSATREFVSRVIAEIYIIVDPVYLHSLTHRYINTYIYMSTLCIVFRSEMNRISHHSSLFAGSATREFVSRVIAEIYIIVDPV